MKKQVCDTCGYVAFGDINDTGHCPGCYTEFCDGTIGYTEVELPDNQICMLCQDEEAVKTVGRNNYPLCGRCADAVEYGQKHPYDSIENIGG